MKTKIIRADGIEYERKKREVKYDKNIFLRISQKDLDLLKKVADKKGVKYSDIVRNLIEEYLVMEDK